jgi:hypothetical protein
MFPPIDPNLNSGGLLNETKARAPRTELFAQLQSLS